MVAPLASQTPSASGAPPAVSVIVPAYRVAHLIVVALRSLQAQRFTDWEAIVVDDGSPDDVSGAVAGFAADPRIRLLRTDNAGVATARNRAIAATRAPLIALLDGDDAWTPDYLETMIAARGHDQRIGFVCCDAVYFGSAARGGRRFSEYASQVPPVTLECVLLRTFNVFTAALIVRSAFDAIGGYDPALPAAEDLDLWIRLLSAGWRAAYVPEPLARYRRRDGSLSADTHALLQAELRVFDKAAAALAGRPEAADARHARLIALERIAFVEGEALILAGRTRAGLRRLRHGGDRTRKPVWRAGIALLTLLPMLGPPLMRWRMAQDAVG